MDIKLLATILLVAGIILCIVGHQVPRFWPEKPGFRDLWVAGLTCWAQAILLAGLQVFHVIA